MPDVQAGQALRAALNSGQNARLAQVNLEEYLNDSYRYALTQSPRLRRQDATCTGVLGAWDPRTLLLGSQNLELSPQRAQRLAREIHASRRCTEAHSDPRLLGAEMTDERLASISRGQLNLPAVNQTESARALDSLFERICESDTQRRQNPLSLRDLRLLSRAELPASPAEDYLMSCSQSTIDDGPLLQACFATLGVLSTASFIHPAASLLEAGVGTACVVPLIAQVSENATRVSELEGLISGARRVLSCQDLHALNIRAQDANMTLTRRTFEAAMAVGFTASGVLNVISEFRNAHQMTEAFNLMTAEYRRDPEIFERIRTALNAGGDNQRYQRFLEELARSSRTIEQRFGNHARDSLRSYLGIIETRCTTRTAVCIEEATREFWENENHILTRLEESGRITVRPLQAEPRLDRTQLSNATVYGPLPESNLEELQHVLTSESYRRQIMRETEEVLEQAGAVVLRGTDSEGRGLLAATERRTIAEAASRMELNIHRLRDMSSFEVRSIAPRHPGPAHPDTETLLHPELQSYLTRLHEMGYTLRVDPLQSRVLNVGGSVNSGTRTLTLPPHSTWQDFVHEYQHVLYNHFNIREVINSNLRRGARLSDVVPRETLAQWEAHGVQIRELERSMARGLPDVAANESGAVRAELEALRRAGISRFSMASLGARRYALAHQIAELTSIPAEMRTAAQTRTLYRAMAERIAVENMRFVLADRMTRATLYITAGNVIVSFLDVSGRLRVISTSIDAIAGRLQNGHR